MKFRNSKRTPTKGGMPTLLSWPECQVITKPAQKNCYKRFVRFVGGPQVLVASLTVLSIEKYLAKQFRERTGNAANNDRKNLLAAWNWGRKRLPMPSANPIERTDKLPEIRRPRYVPPLEDFMAVVDVAQGQDKTMLLTYFLTAARKSELLKMKWDDVDLERSRIRLWTKKRRSSSKEQDWLPMCPQLKTLLEAHREQALSDTYVFTRDNGSPFKYRMHVMKRLCTHAGVKPFGFHGIRHLAANEAFDIPGMRIRDIQLLLRHLSPNTTERYLRRHGKNTRAVEPLGLAVEKYT